MLEHHSMVAVCAHGEQRNRSSGNLVQDVLGQQHTWNLQGVEVRQPANVQHVVEDLEI